MAERLWTRAEVAGHGGAAIVIDNVVYDVTEWLDEHPGGPDVLLQRAGGDASQCFHDVGHSDDAVQWRERYKVGRVVPHERWPLVARRAHPATSAAAADSWWSLVRAAAPAVLLAALAVLLYSHLLS